jgi:cation transport ATPase
VISAATAGVAVLSSRFPLLRPAAVVAVLYVSRDLFDRGCANLRRGRYLGVSLVWSATLLATMASGHLVAAAVLGVVGGSLSRTIGRIEHDVEQLVRQLLPPEQTGAWVLTDGVEVEVDPREIAPGERVVVNAGHVIPLDGRIQEGRGKVDQPLLGGRSQPQEMGPGDSVRAFTRLLTGRLIILV